MASREELIFMAKVAEQAERFEDLNNYMKLVIEMGQELSIEERNLFSLANMICIGKRRTAWRVLNSIENKEKANAQSHPASQKNLVLIRNYKKKIEEELNNYCNDLFSLIDNHLIKSASTTEAKVFYYKQKGDYYRYITQCSLGDEYKAAAGGALQAYQSASQVANFELQTTNPIRLGLALNFSIFYYEVLNDVGKACQLAKSALDDATFDIEQIQHDQYKDATSIMELIKENLTLWISEQEEDQNVMNS